jgi:hypothetical protein
LGGLFLAGMFLAGMFLASMFLAGMFLARMFICVVVTPLLEDDAVGGNHEVSRKCSGIHQVLQPRLKACPIGDQGLRVTNIQKVLSRRVELMSRGVGKNKPADNAIVAHYGRSEVR